MESSVSNTSEGSSEHDLTEEESAMLSDQVYKQIYEAKKGNPSAFQSYWEFDEDNIVNWTKEEIEEDPVKQLLIAAEKNDRTQLVKILQVFPEFVSKSDDDGYTPLHRASYSNHVEMAKCLMERGADISAKTVDGWQPLHSACKWNNHEVARVLLAAGADVNAQTNGGLTPLHISCCEPDKLETLKLLLSFPLTDLTLKTAIGETAFDLCRRHTAYAALFEPFQPELMNLYYNSGDA